MDFCSCNEATTVSVIATNRQKFNLVFTFVQIAFEMNLVEVKLMAKYVSHTQIFIFMFIPYVYSGPKQKKSYSYRHIVKNIT